MNLSQENKQVPCQPTTPKKRRSDDFEGRSREEKTIIRRPPTIVYVETPKIIHADEDHFMSLVQKLTGNNSSSKSNSSTFQSHSRNEKQIQRKKEKASVILPRLSNVSDDHLVLKTEEDSDSFYSNLVVDDADLFLSSPPH